MINVKLKALIERAREKDIKAFEELCQIKAPETERPETESETEIQAIDTIEDMIGREAAGKLKEAAKAPQSDVSEIRKLMERAGMTLYGSMADEETIYEIYQRDEQEKRLIVMLRIGEQGTGELVCRFTTQEEEMPFSSEILFLFEEWRES